FAHDARQHSIPDDGPDSDVSQRSTAGADAAAATLAAWRTTNRNGAARGRRSGYRVGSGGRIRTCDLRVMSPTSCLTAPPRSRLEPHIIRRLGADFKTATSAAPLLTAPGRQSKGSVS